MTREVPVPYEVKAEPEVIQVVLCYVSCVPVCVGTREGAHGGGDGDTDKPQSAFLPINRPLAPVPG